MSEQLHADLSVEVKRRLKNFARECIRNSGGDPDAALSKLVDATDLAIIYHPELRGKLSDSAKADIHKMLTTLAYSVEKKARSL